MKVWLALPLVTATRVMHNVFSDSKPYVFTSGEVDLEDKARFQFLLWRSRFDNVTSREPNGRLVVAFQTPFVLNEQDLCEFVDCHSVSSIILFYLHSDVQLKMIAATYR